MVRWPIRYLPPNFQYQTGDKEKNVYNDVTYQPVVIGRSTNHERRDIMPWKPVAMGDKDVNSNITMERMGAAFYR